MVLEYNIATKKISKIRNLKKFVICITLKPEMYTVYTNHHALRLYYKLLYCALYSWSMDVVCGPAAAVPITIQKRAKFSIRACDGPTHSLRCRRCDNLISNDLLILSSSSVLYCYYFYRDGW